MVARERFLIDGTRLSVQSKSSTELTEKGVPFADYGTWAMGGWYQIFFYDPAGNIIEVHQAKS